MKREARFFLLFFWGLPLAVAAKEALDPVSIFRQGNAVYRGGEYAEAAQGYEKLIAEGRKQADFYYNLGNAYFKQGKVGPAIVQYERALRLDPRDADIRANLKYVKGLLEYRVEDKRNWYLKALDQALRTFTEKEVGILALSLGLVVGLGWIYSLYVRPEAAWGWRRKTVLFLAVIAFGLWALKGFSPLNPTEAVVLQNQANVRYGPSYKDQVALRLGEGIKVRIVKQAGEWYRVALANGETGWMSGEGIEII